MRRSHSSSNIPLPSQNKRDSRNRDRAKSAVRSSREKSLETPLAHRLLPSGASKYSAQKNLIRTPTTPSTFSGFKRSSSLSSFGSRVSVTRNKSPCEKKTFLKLVNDKKWVAEQYSKVQKFIQTRGYLRPELAGMIRPPTIAIFVEIISVLFRLIIKTVPITIHNYGDIVIHTLKLLRYPGNLTPSFLKSINVMHAWPNFIALMSWLIDRIDLEAVHHKFREQQDDDIKKIFYMHDAVFDFFSSQHYISLEAKGENADEKLLQSDDDLYAEMLRITGIDKEAALKLDEQLVSERAELAAIEKKLQEVEDENVKIHMQNLEKQSVIENYEGSKGDKEQKIKDEIRQLEEALRKHTETKAQLVSTIKELEESISKQSCKFTEKIKILNQIEDLNRIIERKQRKLEDYRVVRDDLDHDLRFLVNEIERKVDNWNVSITKTFLPELKKLRLREKGFHTTGFLEEIIEVRKERSDIQEKLLNECKASQNEIEKLLKQKEVIAESDKIMFSTRKRLEELKQSVELIEEENRNYNCDLEEYKKTHELNIQKLEEVEESKINAQVKTIEDLKQKKENLIRETDQIAKIGLAVIVEAQSAGIQNIKKVEEFLNSLLGDANVYLSESNQNLQQLFNNLVSLQQTNKKLYEAFDEENKK